MSRRPATLLGFDYGDRRIGVAVGQTLTGTATPLTTLKASHGRPNWAAVRTLVDAWRPDALVVGLPLNMDGTEQEVTDRARRFARRLHARHELPLHFADERLSTREARARESAGAPREGRDAVAAQVILEGWMSVAVLGSWLHTTPLEVNAASTDNPSTMRASRPCVRADEKGKDKEYT